MNYDRIAGYLSVKEIPFLITNTSQVAISPIDKGSLELLNAEEKHQLQEQVTHFLYVMPSLEKGKYRRALELGKIVFVTIVNGNSGA